MIIFNGYELAAKKKAQLQEVAQQLQAQGKKIVVAACLYTQDKGGVLYSGLKKEMAEELKIEYRLFDFSINDRVELILNKLKELNEAPEVTGIIIQKPMRRVWATVSHVDGEAKAVKKAYDSWWHLQTQNIALEKDVDGLHPSLIEVLKAGQLEEKHRVLPATVKAVLAILRQAPVDLAQVKIAILGKSDLLGLPLYYYFLSKNYTVELLGSRELEDRQKRGVGLTDCEVVISATGQAGLITGDLIKKGAVVIDAGEPKGDVDVESLGNQASFITPVPGGVGPMTVASLMESALYLGGL